MRLSTTRTALLAALAIALAGCNAGSAIVGLHDAPTQVTTTAPLTAPGAQQIAARVLATADEAASAPAAQAKQLRAQALSGAALAVANASAPTGANQVSATQPLTRTEPPKILAISRGVHWPRVILVQTTTTDGAAILNLLSSPDARTPFRISARATMHPGATVAALDSLRQGSPLLADGSTLAVAPAALTKEYAASLAYPKGAPAKDLDESDPFSTAVRANAAAQAKSFGPLATLTRTHSVVPDQTVTIALRGGGALVFALMVRTDTITLKPGGKSLTPSADFQRLVRKKTLTRSAELKSFETVVFTVPDQGQASVVAVDETLFSAKGA